jgi:DNA-binding MarR family transcriptional regulator
MSQPLPPPTSSKTPHPRFGLDEAIHQPVRLSIFGLLAHAEKIDFAFLREHLGVKDANLSQHLTALETLGYITIEKSFVGKRARTWVALSDAGRAAFMDYLDVLQQIVAHPLDGPAPNERGET